MSEITDKNLLFNALKHHLGETAHFIHQARQLNRPELERKFDALKSIGSSTLDFYSGPFSVAEIFKETLMELQKISIYKEEEFLKIIQQQSSQYCTLTFSDQSVWVLRLGNEAYRFVHIHPGRYSSHTLRTSANALKSSLAVLLYSILHNVVDLFDVKLINSARERIQLSPVHSLEQIVKIRKMITLIHQAEQNY
jgi:hypothetical protein